MGSRSAPYIFYLKRKQLVLFKKKNNNTTTTTPKPVLKSTFSADHDDDLEDVGKWGRAPFTKCLLSARCSFRHHVTIISLDPQNSPGKYVLLSSLSRWRNWGSRRWRGQVEVIELVEGSLCPAVWPHCHGHFLSFHGQPWSREPERQDMFSFLGV